MMIAGETRQATVGVEPRGDTPLAAADVSNWAHGAACAASHTILFMDAKRLVSQQALHEDTPEQVAVRPRPMAFVGIDNTSLSFDDERYDVV